MINKGKYSNQEIKEMDIIKNSLNRSRLQELINYAKNSNYKKIGIANCLSMQKYANKLMEILQKEGFDVVSVNCKNSGLQNSDLFGEEAKGPSCDPLSQAEFLNNEKTDLNINVGLCLGHGILFSKHSNAPTTTFIVKDFATNHYSASNLE